MCSVNFSPATLVTHVPISSRRIRKRPIEEGGVPDFKTVTLSPIDIVTGKAGKDIPGLEEPKVEFQVKEFFEQILPEIANRHSFGEARLNAFLGKLDLVQKKINEAPEKCAYECWIKKGDAYLLLSVLADAYHSTTFKEKGVSGKYLYFLIDEWKPLNGGTFEDTSVHLRLDPVSGEGEWMWIRKSSSFSGSEAKEFAAVLSRLFMKEATLWDTAKVQIKTKNMFLFRWNQIVKGNDGFFYTDKGFQVKDLKGVQGAEMVFTQSRDLHRAAVRYLKHISVKEIKSYMTSYRATELSRIQSKYQGEEDPLAMLARKVEAAFRDKVVGASCDKLWLYGLISGDLVLKSSPESDLFNMATQVSCRTLLLTAQPDFKEVVKTEQRPFEVVYQEFQNTNPTYPNDAVSFISWFQQ